MKVQIYYVKLTKQPKGDHIVGSPVFANNDSDDILGFIFDYNKKSKVAGVCFFEPMEMSGDLDFMLYSEEDVNYKEYAEKMFENNPDCKNDWEFDVPVEPPKKDIFKDKEDWDEEFGDDDDDDDFGDGKYSF